MNEKNTKIIDIKIDGDENEYKKQVKYFLDLLIQREREFCEELEAEEKEWNEITNKFENEKNQKYSDVYYYVPEKIRNKSPITFFNSEWGSGKSKFFDVLLRELISNNGKWLKNTKFKKVAVIDLWTYINSENIAEDILTDCFKIIFPENKRDWNKILKILEKANSSVISSSKSIRFLLSITSLVIGVLKLKKVTKETIFNNVTPTIFIFENLERLENKSIEIIKLIQKLTIIKDLIIIFPVAKNKIYSFNQHNNLDNNQNNNYINCKEEQNDFCENEHWLNKYATLGVEYKFQQEYTTFIKNKNISGNNELIKIKNEQKINKMFIKSKLKFRGLENRISFNNNQIIIQQLFEKSKYHAFYFIEKEMLETNIDETLISLHNDFENIEKVFWNLKYILSNNSNLEESFSKLFSLKDNKSFSAFFENKSFCSFLYFFNSQIWMSAFFECLAFKHLNEQKIEFNKHKDEIISKNKLFWIFDFLNINNFLKWVTNSINQILSYIINETKININLKGQEDFYSNEIDVILKMIDEQYTFFVSLLKLIKIIISTIKENKEKLSTEIEFFNLKENEYIIGQKEFEFLSKNIENNMYPGEFIKKLQEIIEDDIKKVKKQKIE